MRHGRGWWPLLPINWKNLWSTKQHSATKYYQQRSKKVRNLLKPNLQKKIAWCLFYMDYNSQRHGRNHPCHQGAHGPQERVLTLFQVTTWIASRNVCEHWVPKPHGIPSFHQQNPQDIQHTHITFTPHPKSLKGSSKPTQEEKESFGFCDINSTLVNTLEAI